MSKQESKFTDKTPAEELAKGIDLKNKNIVVTGGSSGIGLETARVLVKQGATVILASRKKQQLEEAKKKIVDSTGKKNVFVVSMDLGDLNSIDKAVAEIKKIEAVKKNGIHVLINNAGIMAVPHWKTKQGFESQIGINHFGHFKLTMELLPLLVQHKSPARVVNLSSSAHTRASIDFDDIFFEKRKYHNWTSYAQSKLANIVFTFELNRKLKQDKLNIIANAVHPGIIRTGLAKDIDPNDEFLKKFTKWPIHMWKSIPQGASTTILAAIHPSIKTGGNYMEDNKISTPADNALKTDSYDKLWKLSEKLCGVSYDKQLGKK